MLEILALAMARYDRHPELITADDAELMQTLIRAREALEDIYGQRFTFQGESRDSAALTSEHDYDIVAGEVTAMEAAEAIQGSAATRIRARRVEAGAKVVGMKARVIDGRS
ncbi:hypothetical protein ACFCX6_21950 [Streptomyces sp. NPDC056353]|uniref:hypothetical protein n=1 Tax=Streptomyces sp. NPDC056353 TaxID=3345792 RepID=UPI0035D7F7C6